MKFYFHLNPEILCWHDRLEKDVKTKGYVRNKFGRRMEFWFRKDNPTVMNEICAAIPQSSISDLINKIWVQVVKDLPEVSILMQVHDSLVFQYKIEDKVKVIENLPKVMRVGIPYIPVLYIDMGFKYSSVSYGDCL